MIKLNAGLSRKVGEANYGSRGASVNLELEVESNLVNDPEALMNRIRRLFQLARQAVDQELGSADVPYGNGNGQPRANGRPATAAQIRAIRSLAGRLGLPVESLLQENLAGPEQLSLQQASTVIDDLKARLGVSPNGRR